MQKLLMIISVLLTSVCYAGDKNIFQDWSSYSIAQYDLNNNGKEWTCYIVKNGTEPLEHYSDQKLKSLFSTASDNITVFKDLKICGVECPGIILSKQYLKMGWLSAKTQKTQFLFYPADR